MALAATLMPVPARAASTTAPTSTTPVLVTSQTRPPLGYRLTAAQVRRIAADSPTIHAELQRHLRLVPYEYTSGPGNWQVSWFTPGTPQRELAVAYVDDADARVTQAWTGYQVAWTMARGYPGAFGRQVDAWWVWLPLCLLFVAPFVSWRERRRLSLWHLDLLMLLGFSISLAFFNHGEIGISVPAVYPFLLYLLVRMLALGFGRGRPRGPLALGVPVSWLTAGTVFLIGFRVALDVVNSNVIDVGYAGVIGADKLLHGHPLYGMWPADNLHGDTYGPVVYYAYLPFRLIFGWSGTWDRLPAAHAAAIAFDLITIAGLYMLGWRLRGRTGAVVLTYLWVAYPFTLWSLCSNTNDTLVAMLVVLALVFVGSPPARGALAALAGLTKFAPLVLAPLLWRGAGRRLPVWYPLAFVGTVVIAMAPVVFSGDLGAFWRDSIAYQAGRGTPFSVWGFWGLPTMLHQVSEGATVALAIAVAFAPRRRGLVEIAALGGALLIATQLVANYWLYSYLVWFFPLVVVALVAAHPALAQEGRVGDLLPIAPLISHAPARRAQRTAAGSSTSSIESARSG